MDAVLEYTSSDSEFSDNFDLKLSSTPDNIMNLCGKPKKEDKVEQEVYQKADENQPDLTVGGEDMVEKEERETPQEEEVQQEDITVKGVEDVAEEMDKEKLEDVGIEENISSDEEKENENRAADIPSSIHFTFSSPEEALSAPTSQSEGELEKASDEAPSSVEKVERVASDQSIKSDKEKKKSAVGQVSRFFKSKRDLGKESSESDETCSDEEGKKKRGGALGHVSRFIGKAVKKDKPNDMELEAGVVEEKKDIEELTYSEVNEEIPQEITKSVTDLRSEIDKIVVIINNFSRALEIKPRIVTYTMVNEAEELKQRITDLMAKIPNNMLLLDLLELEDTKSKFKKRWEVIRQELDAMDTLTDAIRANIVKRQSTVMQPRL